MSVSQDLETRRVKPSSPEQYTPIFGEDAPVHQQILAWSPAAAEAVMTFMAAVYTKTSLDARLIELVRLRTSFHNQCRTCMATRNQDVGITEDMVCSLEKPEEAPDLTDREKAALHYADLFSTDHFAITDQTFERLHQHFTAEEIIDLQTLVCGTMATGRMLATWDIVENIPERFQQDRGAKTITPWGNGDVLVNSPDMSGKIEHRPGLQRA